MLTVHKNAVSPGLLTDIQAAFARVEKEIGFEDQFYMDMGQDAGEVMRAFRRIINPPEFVQHNNQALLMERTHILKQHSSAPWLRGITRAILDIVTPLANIKTETSPIFTRVHLPSTVHVDSELNNQYLGYTVLIPLTFDSSIKTIAWSNQFDTMEDLQAWKQSVVVKNTTHNDPVAGLNGIDLRHCGLDCDVPYKYWPEYLQDPQAGAWEPGNILVFERRSAHCSSNFRNHLPFKDYVLIHTHDGI